MYRYFYLLIIFTGTGCTSEILSQKYLSGAICLDQKKEFMSDRDYVLSLLACGNKLKAEAVAKESADRGNVEVMGLYADILNRTYNQDFGLLYEIKAAEKGDFSSARRILAASKKNNISSLDSLIFKNYLAYFKVNKEFTIPDLKEYVEYAVGTINENTYAAASYGMAYIELTKDSAMSENNLKEYNDVVKKLKDATDRYGITKEVLANSCKIISQADNALQRCW